VAGLRRVTNATTKKDAASETAGEQRDEADDLVPKRELQSEYAAL
jgi:hypothetical protein